MSVGICRGCGLELPPEVEDRAGWIRVVKYGNYMDAHRAFEMSYDHWYHSEDCFRATMSVEHYP